jgi:hypothetical protein
MAIVQPNVLRSPAGTSSLSEDPKLQLGREDEENEQDGRGDCALPRIRESTMIHIP